MQRAGNQEIAWEMAFLPRFTALRTVTSLRARFCHFVLAPCSGVSQHLVPSPGVPHAPIKGRGADLISV